jgi:hypothetical protein
MTLQFAVDTWQLFALGKANRLFLVTSNRCVPVKNIFAGRQSYFAGVRLCGYFL